MTASFFLRSGNILRFMVTDVKYATNDEGQVVSYEMDTVKPYNMIYIEPAQIEAIIVEDVDK